MRTVCIVLNWKKADLTIRCVMSLREQGIAERDIIVVDNASDDGSVEAIACAHPRVRIVQTGTNLGYGGGNNRGIEVAMAEGADFVWVLNNDVWVEPGTLNALLDAMLDARVAACTPAIHPFPGTSGTPHAGWGRVWPLLGRAQLQRTPWQEDARGPRRYLSGTALLLRSAALERPVFDERFFLYWEDVDLSLRLQGRGWLLRGVHDVRVLHMESASLGKQSATLIERGWESRIRFLRKHSILGFVLVWATFPLVLLKHLVQGKTRILRAECRGMVEGMRHPQRSRPRT